MPKIATLCLVLCAAPALASVEPVPQFSTCVLGGQPLPCQYRFRADGLHDVLTVTVTLRDEQDVPVNAWPVSCALATNAGTIAFCSCCPTTVNGLTNASGVVVFYFRKLGGRGSLDVVVDAGPVDWTLPIAFTSVDQNGSCEALPGSATNVIDLAIWAHCLPPQPYCVTSDFNCNGAVNVVDVSFLATALGKGCGPPCP